MKRIKSLLPLIFLIAIGLAVYFSGSLDILKPHSLIDEQQQLQELVDAWPWLSRLALIALVVFTIATGMPGTIVPILAAGFVFGIIEGTLYSEIGLIIGSLVLFFTSRHAFRDGGREPPPLVRRLRDGYHRHPLNYTLFVRLVPLFPFGAVTIALAWLRCPLKTFLLATVIGSSIMLVFETAIGAGLADYLADGQELGLEMLLEPRIAIPLAVLAVMTLVPIVLNWRRRPVAAETTNPATSGDESRPENPS